MKNEIAKNAHNLRGAEQKETRKVERFAQKFRVRAAASSGFRLPAAFSLALLPEVVKDAGSRSGQGKGRPNGPISRISIHLIYSMLARLVEFPMARRLSSSMLQGL